MKRYPLARPHMGKEEEAAVLRVLRSRVLSIGPEIAEFERRFAATAGTKFACAVSSGTAGLHLALLAAGVQKGDEVITSPFSFVASANAILYVGAKPVFVDIEPTTFTIDPARIAAAITRRTKAILPVHIFGQAADMDPIMRLARRHKLKVVEDACESLDAAYRGRKVGTFGESAVFAFYGNKQMTTGEGGMIVSDSPKIDALCRSLRNQGRGADMQWLDHERLGYNYRMDEMSAAVGVAQIKKLDVLIGEKRRLAALYAKHLAPYADLLALPETAEGNTHSQFVYVVRLKDRRISRDEVIGALGRAGIGSKAYLPSIHLFKFYREQFGYRKGDFPVSESVSGTALALPFYIGLSEKDIRHIAKTLIRIIHNHGRAF